jgi:hypothetical protein
VKTSKFDAWINKLLSTEAEEISCSECFDLLPGVVELEIWDKPPLEISVKVHQHLNQCQVCRDEYEILSSLARMDADGEGPVLEE